MLGSAASLRVNPARVGVGGAFGRAASFKSFTIFCAAMLFSDRQADRNAASVRWHAA
jgi:hypothetical protein